MMRSNIVRETDNYIVVHKPAGIATQTAKLGQKDLISEIKNYLADSEGIKNPYLAVINRLDQPVEGLVLLAKNEKSAAYLSGLLNNGKIQKYYRASVYGHMSSNEGRLEDFLIKDAKSNLSKVTDRNNKQAKRAVLEYKVVERNNIGDTLDIRLITGRHHQIRVQLSHAGCPILGDMKYASHDSAKYNSTECIRNISLKAYKLILENEVIQINP
ncbi:MAG: RNA pseudouridine synthase [Lachnospiraceae bacterium]|nr:RNA pseudouridine synthase [Lachnospiraceae bacterium]